MLDKARLEGALDDDIRGRKRRRRIALLDQAVRQDVAGISLVQLARSGAERGVQPNHRRARLIGDRNILVADAVDRLVIADQGHDRLAAKPHLAVRQNWLVLDVGINAKSVVAGHLGRRQDLDEARPFGVKVVKGTEREGGARVGGAHGAQPQGVLGGTVGAENLAAVDQRKAVGLRHTGAHRLADARFVQRHTIGREHAPHRLHDLAVAGAAAEDAAQGVADFALVRRFVAPQQACRRHQHARRANAALRRAVQVKCVLQGGQRPVGSEPLDGNDLARRDLRHRCHAGANLRAVD